VSTAPPGAEEVQAALELGLAAFHARDLAAAHQAFERAYRRDPRHPRAASWYGVTLVLVERNSALGVSLCDQALRPGPDPELLLNLARVHLALNSRERTVKALQRGLQAAPGHPGLLAAVAALGMRRDPVLPFLSRGNPLNRLLGRLRHRWRVRHAPPYDLSPVALGAQPIALRHPIAGDGPAPAPPPQDPPPGS
jgi:tetratricopeptide (TPR) repeat protein